MVDLLLVAHPGPLLLFIFCRLFMAFTNDTSLSCENMINYDRTRTSQQNTIIARHFAALLMLIACDGKTISQILYNLFNRQKNTVLNLSHYSSQQHYL